MRFEIKKIINCFDQKQKPVYQHLESMYSRLHDRAIVNQIFYSLGCFLSRKRNVIQV